MERLKVIGYVRVSTARQAEHGWSLETQRERLSAFCTAMDHELIGIEVDDASGKTLDRPGLMKSLDRLKLGQANALLVIKLDRLTRSVKDLGELLEEHFQSATLLSVSDSIDTRTASGRLVLNVLTSVSQWEREAISERTKEVLCHLKANGTRLGPKPLGIASNDQPDYSEQETIRHIWELRGSGLSLREIAFCLQETGHKTKRGGRWSAETIRLILLRRKEDARESGSASKQ